MKSQKALEMASNMISLLMKKIQNYQDGYYIDTFHYDQCFINEKLVIVIGNGTIIVHENFSREGVSSSGVGNIDNNAAGTDYGWLLWINDTYAFIDCDKNVHIWKSSNGKNGSLYHVEHESLNEASKQFLSDLKSDNDEIKRNEVVITFAND